MSQIVEAAAQPLVQVDGISYRYGAFMALTNVSLTVRAGELAALIGRNGAGKSTLLRCIAGWSSASDGEVSVMGRSVRRAERWLREQVVLVPDKPPFYDELTAWEHLQFIAQAHGVADWRERSEALLERYGLINNRDAFPFAFSRGMQYKLALCMGLLIQPALLLLDEPLGPLDPVSADDLWHDLNDLSAGGMAIVLSSHQLPPDAHPHSYHVMENGEVIASGTPDQLRESLALGERFTLDDMLRAAILRRREQRRAEGEDVLDPLPYADDEDEADDNQN